MAETLHARFPFLIQNALAFAHLKLKKKTHTHLSGADSESVRGPFGHSDRCAVRSDARIGTRVQGHAGIDTRRRCELFEPGVLLRAVRYGVAAGVHVSVLSVPGRDDDGNGDAEPGTYRPGFCRSLGRLCQGRYFRPRLHNVLYLNLYFFLKYRQGIAGLLLIVELKKK